jgi:hypothetical protein
MSKKSGFQVVGQNNLALFTMKLHRGEGKTLIAMNWKNNKPPDDFVGFAIEYQEPGGDKFYPLKNRLRFESPKKKAGANSFSTRLAPIQKFRWVHFPQNADLPGDFIYRVTPVFMNQADELSYGEYQEAAIVLKRETYPNQLNVAFTRGFVSSQAFVDRYESKGPISTLLPSGANTGLNFKPTHPETKDALEWMGFEARMEILGLLDTAISDPGAKVFVVAYDLNEPEIVSRLEKLKSRLRIIIDDDGPHGTQGSAENQAEVRLKKTAGANNVKRQHMGKLQHNKTIVVDGTNLQAAICGSTNFSWRGLYVQSNNAVIVYGDSAIKPFLDAFYNYWANNSPQLFGNTNSATINDLGLNGIDAKISFSPHSANNALLSSIADDIEKNTTSCLLYSLAFLYQTPGSIKAAIKNVSSKNNIFSYGVSDKKVAGLDIHKPNGTISPLYPAALSKNIPEPFKSEPTGGGGTRMHHKFIVIDFDKPTARVYLGSYNFSGAADTSNGENLLIIRDQKITVSYMIDLLCLVDHYHFRVTQNETKKAKKILVLSKPPRTPQDIFWWSEYYTDIIKIQDRILFS